jgi:hypothetical protein
MVSLAPESVYGRNGLFLRPPAGRARVQPELGGGEGEAVANLCHR